MDNRRPGCLAGLFQLFLLDKVYDWLQRTFGYKSGSCMGCGCGTIFFIIFVMILFSIIFRTNWFRFSF